MGTYLVAEKAHVRILPQDFTPSQCRDAMRVYDSKGLDTNGKVEEYNKICNGIQPVLHHFFLENFLTPGMWFESRLNYIKSVATASMVGYILGIGDRHVHNIMIDKNTGEVVHIDFGIAFEQGKILPHPETIPFRLTRDVTAPFGLCGVDGIFKK